MLVYIMVDYLSIVVNVRHAGFKMILTLLHFPSSMLVMLLNGLCFSFILKLVDISLSSGCKSVMHVDEDNKLSINAIVI